MNDNFEQKIKELDIISMYLYKRLEFQFQEIKNKFLIKLLENPEYYETVIYKLFPDFDEFNNFQNLNQQEKDVAFKKQLKILEENILGICHDAVYDRRFDSLLPQNFIHEATLWAELNAVVVRYNAYTKKSAVFTAMQSKKIPLDDGNLADSFEQIRPLDAFWSIKLNTNKEEETS